MANVFNLEDMIKPVEGLDELTDILANIDITPENFDGHQGTIDMNRQIMQDASKEIDQQVLGLKIPDYLINDPEIIGYPSVEFQTQIYDWVNESLPSYGYTIKDLGAGRGDFFGHINDRDDVHYFGLELNPNLCDVAKQKYPEINILNNDYFDTDIQTDYTVCIGTLGDNLGQDKWEYLNKTLNWAMVNTKRSIIFILQRDCYGNEQFLDYPLNQLFENINPNIKFVLDYSNLEDIYKLVVNIDNDN